MPRDQKWTIQDLTYHILHIPSSNSRRRELSSSLFAQLEVSELRFRKLDASPVQLMSIEDCRRECEDRGFPFIEEIHQVFFMHTPQNNSYKVLGDWKGGVFYQYSNIRMPAPGNTRLGHISLNFSLDNILTSFMKSKYRLLLFLEDDAILSEDWCHQLELVLEAIDFEFDVLNLAGYSVFNEEVETLHRASNPRFLLPYRPANGHILLFSESGARKFHEFLKAHGPVLGADWILFNVRSPQIQDRAQIDFLTYFINPRLTSICPWSDHYLDTTISSIGESPMAVQD